MYGFLGFFGVGQVMQWVSGLLEKGGSAHQNSRTLPEFDNWQVVDTWVTNSCHDRHVKLLNESMDAL